MGRIELACDPFQNVHQVREANGVVSPAKRLKAPLKNRVERSDQLISAEAPFHVFQRRVALLVALQHVGIRVGSAR